MSQTISNQASLSYKYGQNTGSATSNIATAILTAPLTIDLRSYESTYRTGRELTFVISAVNLGTEPLSNVAITDDLVSYKPGGSGTTTVVTPLNYISEALLYENGVAMGTITPTLSANSMVFYLTSIGAGVDAQIVYKARVNEYAPLAAGSSILSTVSAAADGINDPPIDTNKINVDAYADVSIFKNMSPTTITDGTDFIYKFSVSNSGNTLAEKIVITDEFNPASVGTLEIRIDGTLVDAANFSYTANTLTLSVGTTYKIPMPAANITQDMQTGKVTVVPSTKKITVKAKL